MGTMDSSNLLEGVSFELELVVSVIGDVQIISDFATESATDR